MRIIRTVLVVGLVLAGAFALAAAGLADAQAPGPAARPALPAALANRLGGELPEVVWMGFHPTRDDGAWVLLDGGWTLVTGFPADARAEVKKARKRPSETPPLPLPDAGVALHVVSFGTNP